MAILARNLSDSALIERIEKRVDHALAANSRTEALVTGMAAGIFLLGIGVILAGYWLKNPYVFVGGGVSQLLLWRPIDAIVKLRQDNLILQTFPTLMSGLSREKASNEIVKLLRHLRARG